MAPKGEALAGAGQEQRRGSPAARLYAVAALKAVFSVIAAVWSVPAGAARRDGPGDHNPDTSMTTSVPGWEGPMSISGSHSGTGYLEMSGHDE